MATRERTVVYIKLRSEAKSKSLRRRQITAGVTPEGRSLISDAQSTPWEEARANLPPQYVQTVETVNEDLRKIKEKVEELSKLHTKRLMVKFDDSTTHEEEREIEQLTSATTDVFRHAEKALQRVTTKDPTLSSSEQKIRMNIQRSLATQLQNLSSDFRKSQKEYLNRVALEKKGPEAFEFLESQDKLGAINEVDPGFTQEQMASLELSEALINERDHEIQQIAKSIEELATIFKELAVLVIDQGTILDRIDYNMEQVIEQTTIGVKELEAAEKIQKANRPVKCILILLGLIFFMLILLIEKHL